MAGEIKSKRLLSLDVLRGFDMLFIMGLAPLITAICALFPGGTESWVAENMKHVPWHGLTHHDTIFPLFLFVAGISFPFSFAKQVSKGKTKKQIYGKIFFRGLFLVFLGFVYNGLFNLNFSNMRWASVLGRIGLAWMFAALLFINFKTSARIIIASFILVAYWLLIWLVPSPDAPAGSDPFSAQWCLQGYIDRVLLPGKLYGGTYDPEGLLSTIPAIVTAMLGMFTGEFVKKEGLGMKKKAAYMLLASTAMLGAGLIWSIVFPVNKQLWTSSFVLVVGAYSLAMFTLFYWLIDIKGWRKGTIIFEVVGLNSITIYLAQRIIDFHGIAGFFTGGAARLLPQAWGHLLLCLGYIAVCWLFLYFLYKKKVFLKV